VVPRVMNPLVAARRGKRRRKVMAGLHTGVATASGSSGGEGR